MSRNPIKKKCTDGILDDRQIKTLLRGRYDSENIMIWRDYYGQVKKLYLDICENCQYPYSDNNLTPRAIKIIEQIDVFIDIMNSKIIPMTLKSTEMRDAMTLLLCREKRCQNLKPWSPMDSSFLNWVAHRLSEIGHNLLGLSNDDIMGFGKPKYEDTLNEVETFLKIRRINETKTLNNLRVAQKCYRLEYQVRDLRYPELISGKVNKGFWINPIFALGGNLSGWAGSGKYFRNAICGEGYSDSHIYRRNISKSLSVGLSKIILLLELEEEIEEILEEEVIHDFLKDFVK